MLPYLFAILFPLSLIGLAVLCIAARRTLSRADNTSTGRAALLMAMTKVPIAPELPPRSETNS